MSALFIRAVALMTAFALTSVCTAVAAFTAGKIYDLSSKGGRR